MDRRRTGRADGGHAAVDAAIAAGATGDGAPFERLHHGPGHYVGTVLDPDGYRLELVHQPWQHAGPFYVVLTDATTPSPAGSSSPVAAT